MSSFDGFYPDSFQGSKEPQKSYEERQQSLIRINDYALEISKLMNQTKRCNQFEVNKLALNIQSEIVNLRY